MASQILNQPTGRVADFAPGRFTEAQYDAERARIRAMYGDTATERTGAFDQELARLFDRSGWGQEQLAVREGRSQGWIDKRLRFGRFLKLIQSELILKSLTEGRFRGFWKRTDTPELAKRNLSEKEKEPIRFREVARLMESELDFSKPHRQKKTVAKAILEKFGDGHWHRLDVIAKGVETEEAEVIVVLESMRGRGTYRTACERRQAGGGTFSYRIVRGVGRKVDVDILMKELGPIVHELEVEGKKHIAEASPPAIAMLAHKLKRILERLTHEDARRFRRSASKEKPDETV